MHCMLSAGTQNKCTELWYESPEARKRKVTSNFTGAGHSHDGVQFLDIRLYCQQQLIEF